MRLIALFLGIAFLIEVYPIRKVQAQLSLRQCSKPEKINYSVQKVIARDRKAFTQGLVMHSGFLYESAGKYGKTELNKIDPESGQVQQLASLPYVFFGEGLDFWNGTFLQLTWKEHRAFLWEEDESNGSLTSQGGKEFKWEGWGVTHDQKNWIVSDGSPVLRFLSPNNLKEDRSVVVMRENQYQKSLNELEIVDNQIFANIFQTNEIVRTERVSKIQLNTICVNGILDLSKLREYFSKEQIEEIDQDLNSVANGIAYDAELRELYITGKNWPLIFRIKLV